MVDHRSHRVHNDIVDANRLRRNQVGLLTDHSDEVIDDKGNRTFATKESTVMGDSHVPKGATLGILVVVVVEVECEKRQELRFKPG